MQPATPLDVEVPAATQTDLTEAELHAVSGGLNPQPLPPRVEFRFQLTSAAAWTL
jgi:hypothetical protein